MPGLAQRKEQLSNGVYAIGANGFWSKRRDELSYHQLQKFWNELAHESRHQLLQIDKQTLFEQARKNMYCARCNGLLLEGFLHIIMYGKCPQKDEGGAQYNFAKRVVKNQPSDNSPWNISTASDVQDPSSHPWGGLTATREGSLTLLDCYVYSKSLKSLQNVFDSARGRERERELLYPDACGGGGRGWLSQIGGGYARVHGTRESCALHTARLSCDTLVDFWSALGDETRQSLSRMKEEDFIERLMYRFDSKRFCRDCRRNVIREFKELKELKRMKRQTRCTSWFCVADTAFQYEVTEDTIFADWRQTFADSMATYHHFEWAVGTSELLDDIYGFKNVGTTGTVQVSGLSLGNLNACYITLRAYKMDGRFTDLCVKAHALKGQQCVHCRLIVGDGFVTITRQESIRIFFEHAEEAEEEEDEDSMDKDSNELESECSRPQRHAKSPELAREFLLDAATVIFKEQVEKAFREGTARQNAHSIFVCLALQLLEERLHVACKEIITLERQMKLLEEEEIEKREEEERKERKRTKDREKKLRRKERLKGKDKDKEKSRCESVDTSETFSPSEGKPSEEDGIFLDSAEVSSPPTLQETPHHADFDASQIDSPATQEVASHHQMRRRFDCEDSSKNSHCCDDVDSSRSKQSRINMRYKFRGSDFHPSSEYRVKSEASRDRRAVDFPKQCHLPNKHNPVDNFGRSRDKHLMSKKVWEPRSSPDAAPQIQRFTSSNEINGNNCVSSGLDSGSSSDICSSCLGEGDSSPLGTVEASSVSDSESTNQIASNPVQSGQASMLSSLPAQPMQFPVFQPPVATYYHPLSWSPNECIPYHYLYAPHLGYGHSQVYAPPVNPPTLPRHRPQGSNFSLFHFGGPVELTNRGNRPPLHHLRDDDVDPCNKDTKMEEYNLFAASNPMRFSIF